MPLESKKRIVLKQKDTGLYWSNDADRTPKLMQAKTFHDIEYLLMWMDVAHFKPKDLETYEPVDVEITIRELDENEQQCLD